MRFSVIALAAALLGTTAFPAAQASEMDKKTLLTFHRSIEIPGMILPPGEYVMKRADRSLPEVITFTNRRENHVFATVFATPTYRDVATGDVVIVTEERPANQPEALKKWFYPGDVVGAEFRYPKNRPVLMAMSTAHPLQERQTSFSAAEPEVNHAPARPVLESESNPIAEEQAREDEPMLLAQTTSPQEPASTQSDATQSGTIASTEDTAEELPRTGSSLAIWAMLGTLFLAGGLAMKKLAVQSSR